MVDWRWGCKLSEQLDHFKTAGEARLIEILSGVESHLPFIKGFAETTGCLSEIMKHLKCQGLSAKTANACREKLDVLADSRLRCTRVNWLDKHQATQ